MKYSLGEASVLRGAFFLFFCTIIPLHEKKYTLRLAKILIGIGSFIGMHDQ